MIKNFLGIFLLISLFSSAQSVSNSSSEIYDDLLRLQNNTTVMYLAAHPDDENTRVISWLTHEKHVDAVYLSLTRGDGGQNLIGTEKGELLGLLRTQELLEARKMDKGRQWFTRALDFGYSKTATETLKFWDKQKILADVVWAIRKNKPEIIITRFDPNSNGETHGHHTASAILAMEAFDLAGDPKAFPEQLKYVNVWQPQRLFHNTSWWFYGSKEKFEEAEKGKLYTINVGNYYPILGISNNEISSKARSKHACQGFGMALERGNDTEYLKLLKGDAPKSNDIFDGINLKSDNKTVQNLLDKTVSEFKFDNPQSSLNNLLAIYNTIKKENPTDFKIEKVKDLILKTQGIYFEWTAEAAFGTIDEEINTKLEITNRSNTTVKYYLAGNTEQEILPGESSKSAQKFTIKDSKFSNPYWLQNLPKNNLYVVNSPDEIGQAEILNPVKKTITLNLNSTKIDFDVPLQQKTVNPSIGELYEPFYNIPAFTANFEQENFIFSNQPKQITVEVESFVANSTANISLKGSKDWKISAPQDIQFKEIGEKKKLIFTVEPLSKNASSTLETIIESNGKTYNQSLNIVEYPHIDRQIWLKNSQAKIQNLDLKIPAVKIAYIKGSGDDVPASLRAIGMKVEELDIKNWNANILKNYDVLILGIRTFNVNPEMNLINRDLWKFVEDGGLIINQYNTNNSLLTKDIAPFGLSLGRSRISEEDAKLKILVPDSPIFNSPNKITDKDFEAWVQERGLYFANSWDKNLIPYLEGNDLGETPNQGILLSGKYGKGTYVYTGLSFFRELPAGIPGAYKLFMNILALENKN
ncbi:PIG-L family deacetylase [Frigoriflavimonas asaccharolytica]|uniref:LmbE family N-acetylglucosaminyl deacetylase n=1 Tax=Frigoriflavimonas asaccharolytica TaxID=2735899 RepID=A0A8J8K7T7_9FLAO|nr:PIG-L family deacetylase [Frigoriflavimonas asaccharolytica]NRS91277.1 LmbE family N-acetylglucosaminyl deacetylase [Frigoriflavimonas asaccharolytica]